MNQCITRVVQFTGKLLLLANYPRYIADLYLRWWYPSTLRRQGIMTGTGSIWYGKPIISRWDRSTLRIGKDCRICSRSHDTALGINHAVVLRTLAPDAEIRIGDGVRMSGTTICAKKSVIIGDRCVIGANVTIVDTDFHSLDPATRSSPQDGLTANVLPVVIGNDVFIGGGSFILKGVKLGDGTVIGAGSVVTKTFPPVSIVAGNPARQVATLDSTSRVSTPHFPDSLHKL